MRGGYSRKIFTSFGSLRFDIAHANVLINLHNLPAVHFSIRVMRRNNFTDLDTDCETQMRPFLDSFH